MLQRYFPREMALNPDCVAQRPLVCTQNEFNRLSELAFQLDPCLQHCLYDKDPKCQMIHTEHVHPIQTDMLKFQPPNPSPSDGTRSRDFGRQLSREGGNLMNEIRPLQETRKVCFSPPF